MRLSALFLTIIGLSSPLEAQAITVLRGVPSHTVQASGGEVRREAVPATSSGDKQVAISRIGDRLYWASRENVELALTSSAGAFYTFTAVNGAGYVRVLKPSFRRVFYDDQNGEFSFDYVEVLATGLATIHYYGRLREFTESALP